MEDLRFKLDLQTFAANSADKGVAMRYELLSFMNVTPNAETGKYELIGEGFTDMNESLNPQTKESGYIHQKSKSNSITGYAPTFDFTAENYKGDPVCEYIANVGNERLIGKDAETDIVNVLMYKKGTDDNTYVAYQQKVAIRCDQVKGGTGQDAMPLTGSLLYKGDAVKGIFNTQTKAFTADQATTS